MHWAADGLALMLALAIVGIGIWYVARPRGATRGFGLPLPEVGPNIAAWLRLKGVRDIVSGLVVLACMARGEPRVVGVVLLVEALIPMGDMLVVLTGRGSVRRAVGIHGLTAVLMLLAALPLTMREA